MATKTKTTEKSGIITLVPLKDDWVTFTIKGRTPYIPHRVADSVRITLPGAPGKGCGTVPKPKTPRALHDPVKEADEALYKLPSGQMGFPAIAIKSAMVGAARFFEGLQMVQAKVLFHVEGQGPDQIVPLLTGDLGHGPVESVIPLKLGGSILCYRYFISNWSADISIRFISSAITRESIVALLSAAGRLGIGAWRPSSPQSFTGTYGQFEVVG